MEPTSAAISSKLMENIIEGLYNNAKDKAKTLLQRWRTTDKIKTLYKKISTVRYVKTIWQIDKAVDLTKFYYPTKLIIRGELVPINRLADIPGYGNVVLQGIVGQGKSILLRYLCSRELQRGQVLPVFAEFRRMDKKLSLEKFICAQIKNLGVEINHDLFSYLANSGKIVVFLDAFDEVEENKRSGIIAELESLASQYEHLRFIVTSRPDSGIEKSPFFDVVMLAPLEPENVIEMIPMLMPQDSLQTEIIRAINKSTADIEELLTTPLMVTLLVITYKATRKIPEQLSDFYERLFDMLISRHDASKPGFIRKRKSRLNDRQMRNAFDAFCFILLGNAGRTVSVTQACEASKRALSIVHLEADAEHYLDDIKRITCLVLQEEQQIFFIHKSIAEYYGASFVHTQPERFADKFYSRAREQRSYSGWYQELLILREIDTYRFYKYYLLPDFRAMLVNSGGVVEGDWIECGRKFMMNWLLQMTVRFSREHTHFQFSEMFPISSIEQFYRSIFRDIKKLLNINFYRTIVGNMHKRMFEKYGDVVLRFKIFTDEMNESDLKIVHSHVDKIVKKVRREYSKISKYVAVADTSEAMIDCLEIGEL